MQTENQKEEVIECETLPEPQATLPVSEMKSIADRWQICSSEERAMFRDSIKGFVMEEHWNQFFEEDDKHVVAVVPVKTEQVDGWKVMVTKPGFSYVLFAINVPRVDADERVPIWAIDKYEVPH